jgi:hypothetical protein
MRGIGRINGEDERESSLGFGSTLCRKLPIIRAGECVSLVRRRPPLMRGIGRINGEDKRNQMNQRSDHPPAESFLQRLNPDFDFHRLPAASQGEALYRGHIAVVAAPCQGDVGVRRHHVVGGIKTQPAVLRIKH